MNSAQFSVQDGWRMNTVSGQWGVELRFEWPCFSSAYVVYYDTVCTLPHPGITHNPTQQYPYLSTSVLRVALSRKR